MQKYEKYLIFLSENFQFLEIKFSIYLNRRVFVMDEIVPGAGKVPFYHRRMLKAYEQICAVCRSSFSAYAKRVFLSLYIKCTHISMSISNHVRCNYWARS